MTELIALVNILAWPVVIGLALCGFRVPITDLMAGMSHLITSMSQRALKVGAFEAGPPQQTPLNASATAEQGLSPIAPTAPEVASTSGSTSIANRFNDPYRDFALQVEEGIEQELPNIKQRLNLSENEYMLYLAVDSLGALRLERASRSIFRSQIEAIKHLTLSGRMPVDGLLPSYTKAATASPEIYENYTFEQWLSYLTSWGLISREGADATVTPAGKAIVAYMERWGYIHVLRLDL